MLHVHILLTSAVFLVTLLICIWLYQHLSKFFKHLHRIPGPPSYPIFGNVHYYLKSLEQIFKDERERSKIFYPIYKFWCLHLGLVIVLDPDDVEKLLSSSKHIQKSILYNTLHSWLGTGLLTSTGAKWQQRRKILTPAFHFSILPEFVNVFNECTEKLVKILEERSSENCINVLPPITDLTLNAITESVMSKKLTNTKSNNAYKKAVNNFSERVIVRMRKPWFYADWIYNLTYEGIKAKKMLKTLHDFSTNIIREKKIDKSNRNSSYATNKRLAMLDLLIEAQKNGANIDDEGLREEIDTFMFEGHDTTAIALSMILLVLASQKEEQDQIREEIIEVLGDSPDSMPTYNDLQQLPYTERCLKECLRLYPSVPIISREPIDDFKTKSGHVIPKGCVVLIPFYDIHRNPEIFPDPEKFDADRFLPENVKNRHPFAYVPFSAGPRNCIGQKFAMLELKAALCGVLRKFILEPVDRPSDIVFSLDLILRTKGAINVKFVPIKK